jgi:glycosyltransferase involved in cell wall biosynthesis
MIAGVGSPSAFSVVIPLFNKRPFVRRTLDSVLGQTFPPAEVIVIDDGSTDGGAEVVTRIDDRVRVLRQENIGLGRTRNRGFAEARGEWVALIDADDIWLPEHLATLMEVRAAFPAADAVAAGSQEVHNDLLGGALDAGPDSSCRLIDFFRDLRSVLFLASSIAIRRSAFARTTGFSGHRLGEDSEFWVRLALDHPIAVSARRTSIYVRGTGGIMEQAETHMAAGGAVADTPILATLDAAYDAPHHAPRRAAIGAYADRIRTGYARTLLYHGRAAEARRLLDGVRAPSREARIYRLLTRAPPPMLRFTARCYSRIKAALRR